ncbi:hypothetical protein WICMUC_000390 [Wickerhamomyces mucosus]|uniref:Homeobox domain-containing protein n=1 Tax=Wickerhamomyces mucosus TaxID=1378264 RepID=A0A9P8PXK7_9ASCO|nr:hypothetical protein WICMUC_000390 [Wickerhamomyces mucosus]
MSSESTASISTASSTANDHHLHHHHHHLSKTPYVQITASEKVILLLHQQPISTRIHKEGAYKLPSISNMLEKIDNYQTQQQIQDSKLLLELGKHQPQQQVQEPQQVQPQQQQIPPQQTKQSQPLLQSSHQTPSPQQYQPTPSPQTEEDDDSDRTTPYRFEMEREDSVGFNKDSRQSSIESIDIINGSEIISSNSNKKRTNLPRETIKILNDWVLRNLDNPYPNHSQKRLLLERTGLSNVQLSNWFINKRRRRIFSNLSGNNGQPIKKKRLIDRVNGS